MRTTLTIEDDIAQRLRAHVSRRGTTFKAAVNELLRAGLDRASEGQDEPPFVVVPHESAFAPGIDPYNPKAFLADDDIDQLRMAVADERPAGTAAP